MEVEEARGGLDFDFALRHCFSGSALRCVRIKFSFNVNVRSVWVSHVILSWPLKYDFKS